MNIIQIRKNVFNYFQESFAVCPELTRCWVSLGSLNSRLASSILRYFPRTDKEFNKTRHRCQRRTTFCPTQPHRGVPPDHPMNITTPCIWSWPVYRIYRFTKFFAQFFLSMTTKANYWLRKSRHILWRHYSNIPTYTRGIEFAPAECRIEGAHYLVCKRLFYIPYRKGYDVYFRSGRISLSHNVKPGLS